MIEEKIAVSQSQERPLVTFALFAYNQEKYIREAIEGAFAQTYEPLEIILSDDCSQDHTFDIMVEFVKDYGGPHRIVLNRNPVNLGSNGFGLHVNRVMEMSDGELVVFAAGDDISLPQRIRVLVNSWIEAGKPSGSLHSAVETFSDCSGLPGTVVHGSSTFSEQTIVECVRTGAKGVLGASHAITRDLFDQFGPLPLGTLFEDRTLAFRSLLAGRVIYCPEVLVKYRQHGGSITGSEIYTDVRRWSRWVNGITTKYRSFLEDYKVFMDGKTLEPAVLLEIDKGILRAARSGALVTGNTLSRAMAAFYYSSDFRMSDRIAFILQRAGLKQTILYEVLSSMMRLGRLAKFSFKR